MERNKYHGYNPKKTIEARFPHKKKRPANGIHSRDASLSILFEFIDDLIKP